jgi:hypothetical protein
MRTPTKIKKPLSKAESKANRSAGKRIVPSDETMSKLRTPVFPGTTAMEAATGGAYKDPKSGKVKRFSKQYKS